MSNFFIIIFGLYTVILVTIVYVYFFADTNQKGFSGKLARFITNTFPHWVKGIFASCCGNVVVDSCGRVADYVLHQRNPLLIIAYLIVINSAFLGWKLYGEPQLPTRLAGEIHKYGGMIGVVLSEISFFLACTVSPGVVTKESVNRFNHVPFDGLLYVTGKFCKTCRVPKVARSKHCSLCGMCVPIFDHHCIWYVTG